MTAQRITIDETQDNKQQGHKTEVSQFCWIRVISCFAIILLHSLFASNVYFEDTMTEGELLWSKTAENLLMWAVPCFLMVTGSLLLDPDKEIPLSRIYGKYLKRIVLALIIFTFLFQVLGYLMEGEQTIIRGWLNDLFLGQSWAHMWYLYLMIRIHAVMKWAGFDPYSSGPFAFVLMAVLLFMVSFAVTWAIRKIPGVELL